MADIPTTNLGLLKVEEGSSEDTWGAKLNTNFQEIDDLFVGGPTEPVLKVENGGTGSNDPLDARTALGLGTMAVQNASNVAITGGSIDGPSFTRVSGANPSFMLNETDALVGAKNWQLVAGGNALRLNLYDDAWSSNAPAFTLTRSGNTVTAFNVLGTIQSNGALVWHSGNDGNGSGLDADLLDGAEGSDYRNASNLNAGTVAIARLPASVLRNQGAFTGGEVTISTAAASGVPAPGDLWLQYS